MKLFFSSHNILTILLNDQILKRSKSEMIFQKSEEIFNWYSSICGDKIDINNYESYFKSGVKIADILNSFNQKNPLKLKYLNPTLGFHFTDNWGYICTYIKRIGIQGNFTKENFTNNEILTLLISIHSKYSL